MNAKAVLRARAFQLYLQGIPQKQIAEQLAVAEKTIGEWKEQDEWQERQYARLIEQEPEWALRLLTKLIEQQQTLQQIQAQLAALGAPPPTEAKRPRKQKVRDVAKLANMADPGMVQS